MAVNTQFSIAVHILTGLACHCDEDMISANLGKKREHQPEFCAAHYVQIIQGRPGEDGDRQGGRLLAGQRREGHFPAGYLQGGGRPQGVFHSHVYGEQKKLPREFLPYQGRPQEKALGKTQKAMEASLAGITLAQIVGDVKRT